MKPLKYILAVLVPTLAVTTIVYAGSLTAPGAPAASLYTLNDIYTRLTTNGTATEASHSFTTPGSVAPTFHDLAAIYAAIPTIDATKVLSGTTYLGVAGSASAGYAYPSKLLVTGQTSCYNVVTTAAIPCAGTGQDGFYQAGQATSTVDNSNGTITDNATGLMWQKCSVGQSSSDCSGGSSSLMDFSAATSTCTALSVAGHADWRLPNIKELGSLIDYGHVTTAIDPTYFPNAPTGYWSSTVYDSYAGYAWFVILFLGGSINTGDVTDTHSVRCVRSLP